MAMRTISKPPITILCLFPFCGLMALAYFYEQMTEMLNNNIIQFEDIL